MLHSWFLSISILCLLFLIYILNTVKKLLLYTCVRWCVFGKTLFHAVNLTKKFWAAHQSIKNWTQIAIKCLKTRQYFTGFSGKYLEIENTLWGCKTNSKDNTYQLLWNLRIGFWFQFYSRKRKSRKINIIYAILVLFKDLLW